MEPAGPATSVDELLELLRLDPPRVHARAPRGVWAADEDCLRFLWSTVQDGATTLETGLGLSTVVFSLRSADHTSVFLGENEGDVLVKWCALHGVPIAGLQLRKGSSSVVLPSLPARPLDLVMIDGCHGYPFPQIDFYFGASYLREGGVVVVDDLQLAAPWELHRFLEQDPRWIELTGTDRWSAHQLVEPHSLDEDWVNQRFHQPLEVRLQRIRQRTTVGGRRLRAKTRRWVTERRGLRGLSDRP